MMRLTWTLFFMASFTICAVSSIIFGFSMPGTHFVDWEGLGVGFLVAHLQIVMNQKEESKPST
jgi:hypothetical protein